VSNHFSLPFEENDKAVGKKFGSALVCGIERYPLKVTKSMSDKKVERRSRIKPFVKLVNYAHVMPTRYSIDLELKDTVTVDLIKDPSKKKEARKAIKKILEEKHKSGSNKWFFQKLRF
jgi:large subunit ribosomal protein L27e